MGPIAHPSAASLSGRRLSPESPRRQAAALRLAWRGAIRPLACIGPLLWLLLADPGFAASNKVRITNLSDVAFGSIANLSVDAARSENVCLFSDTSTAGYNIRATGTGPGGAFQLASGPAAMAYEVQWNTTTGQNSGLQLTPNVPLTGLTSSATHQTCSTGAAASASLIIVLRSTALSTASAGNYTGTLTLVVGPE